MPSFTPIPDIPVVGLDAWQYAVLSAIKEDVDTLIGVRQAGVKAVTSDGIGVVADAFQTVTRTSAQGLGSSFGGSPTYADFADYAKLVQDVQTVMNDIGRLQTALNTLINSLRSPP